MYVEVALVIFYVVSYLCHDRILVIDSHDLAHL